MQLWRILRQNYLRAFHRKRYEEDYLLHAPSISRHWRRANFLQFTYYIQLWVYLASATCVPRLTIIADNSSRWVSKNSLLRDSPNVWLLVYDPVIPAQEAYETGTAGLTLMNANGFTTITLTPNYMLRRDSTPHYEYDAQVNTSPMLDVVCDVATRNMSSSASTNNKTVDKTQSNESNAYAPCNAPIAFRFANLERQTATERPAMQWGDIVMSVGSYFALVQFVCCVFSGLAWSGAI